MAHLHGSDGDPPASRPVPAAGPGDAAVTTSLEAQLPELRVRLIRHARYALHDDSLAEDLVQDTLITVVEQHTRRRGESTLLTWAVAILKNKVADWYRSPQRRRMVQFNADDDTLGESVEGLYNGEGAYVEAIPSWQQPDNRTEQRQMMTVLEHCVSHLPRQTGRVFMMREWLGFENPEICQRVGVSAENCRTILHRARMALRDCMQRDWIGKKATT